MKVNSISNISFAGTEKKADNKQKRDNYYKYISQVNANEALKMSVGREVTDGKLKVAKEAIKVTGALGMVLTGVGAFKTITKASKAIVDSHTPKAGLEILEKCKKPISAGLAASSALLVASGILGVVNTLLADKTSKERGFIAPLTRFKNMQEAYKATEDVYNAHVKK